jgi:hypothetical protein
MIASAVDIRWHWMVGAKRMATFQLAAVAPVAAAITTFPKVENSPQRTDAARMCSEIDAQVRNAT